MKKLFTVDNFIVAGISGIGYGLGFEIPAILGYEEWQCGVICLIVGFALDKLANAVIFSKSVQSSTANRIIYPLMIMQFKGTRFWSFRHFWDSRSAWLCANTA